MNRDWFMREMSRLLDAALKFPPESMDEHFIGLQDIPTTVLADGVSHAIKTRAWFPTVAELRVDCDAVAGRSRPLAVHPTSSLVPVEGDRTVTIRNPFGGASITVKVTEEPRYYCDRCDDTGMEKFWCGEKVSARWPWMPIQHCGRRQVHGEHEFASKCPCAEMNPAILRRKEAMGTKYSADGKVA